MNRLNEKITVITGAANGLGEADARIFAKEGAKVILADVDDTNGKRIAEEIGNDSVYIHLDVRDEAEWVKVIQGVVESYGRIDVLVNNAGVSGIASPEKITEEQYRKIMSVSVDGTVFGCKHAISAMKKTGGGSIINMSSVASITGEYYCAAYCAAKGAIESYTRAVAVYCAQNNYQIRCNSVHPAAIETQMAARGPAVSALSPETWEDGWLPTALKNPFGQPDDVANLLVYLASDESKFLNGQKIVLDNTATITMGKIPT